MPPLSPLAPARFPDMPSVAGVQLAAAACGLRYRDRPDVLFVALPATTSVAGVFTRSLTASAAVDWCRRAVSSGKARGLVVNSGNANAFTGKAGMASVERTVGAAAKLLKAGKREIFVASTGVIGEPLPDKKITDRLPEMGRSFTADGWHDAARAIATTDTFPKGATRTAKIGGTTVTINGIAKGSGMIAPDMATMLAFVFTDAKLPPPVLRALVARSTDLSFNCMTVDGDTSTSDTMIAFATGAARHAPIRSARSLLLREFCKAFDSLMIDLAQQIVRDGEGASKFVTINVTGAASNRAAKRIALTIANSPLVKTAIAGADANWGRIVMAVGKAGEKADRDRLRVAIGGVAVAAKGAVVAGYDEAPVTAHMKGRDIAIDVDVGVGKGRATVWTCDLTDGYIKINGSYRS
ncbi:MAG: bifunctional glutamate N-acetyltransferase/amino-acid acetyltransferase ArgJ [Rhodospirillales bacterium]|nr:bifunctional glutamate N-acetyltransferase/amino-acid acetyltransferase ArgJ [Rhodospirillales bacterium]